MRTLSIAILTGLFAMVLGFGLGDYVTREQGLSDFEGGRAYFVVFILTPSAILLGIVTGIIAARKIRGPGAVPFLKAQGTAIGVTTVVCSVIGGCALLNIARPPMLGGAPIDLGFEIRMAAGRVAPDSSDRTFSVIVISDGDTEGRVGAALLYDSIRVDAGRTVVPGSLPLLATTRNRSLAINDSSRGYWFDLPLEAKPDSSDMRWTTWWPEPGQSASSDIKGTNGFQLRYRVLPHREVTDTLIQ